MKRIMSLILICIMISSGFVFAEGEAVKIKVNSEELLSDVEATTVEEFKLVPLRAIFEALGLEVSWNSKEKIVTGKNETTLIQLKIGDSKAVVNGDIVELNYPALILENRTMVEVDFIGQATNTKITWNEEENTLAIDEIQEDYANSLTYSNLLDEASQREVRKAMEVAGFKEASMDFFFQDVNDYNSIIEGISLVEDGFVTIEGLEPEYDLVEILDRWDANSPDFFGYNCRIITYKLMEDYIEIGKPNTENSDWMAFDKYALENSPKPVFTRNGIEAFESFYSYIPTDMTKDIDVHLENVKENWKEKDISFMDSDKRSIISVYFHDEEGYLFIGHMGILIPAEDGKLLFIEKLSFQEPYQAIKFDSRVGLNDYLMNKYDISWGQEFAKPFIMENGELLKGYRESPKNIESDLK